MLPLEKSDICFESADGATNIYGAFYTSPKMPLRAIVQVSHGMCEYLARYEELAAFLASHGIVLCGNDHLGHGASVTSSDALGYFSGPGGREYALKDLHTMNRLAHDRFPGLPIILLGHSMGSFFARRYAALWPDTIDGLIICGTGGPNPLVGIGIALTSLLGRLRGQQYRSKLIHDMAFGMYLKQIDAPKTPYDWISRDEAIVEKYNADPLCTYRFTVNGFHELFSTLKEVSGPAWAAALPKTLPTLVIAGEADPVGDYGKGVQTVYNWLEAAGLQQLSLKLYPGMRHEILNEVGREEVYADILRFLGAFMR